MKINRSSEAIKSVAALIEDSFIERNVIVITAGAKFFRDLEAQRRASWFKTSPHPNRD